MIVDENVYEVGDGDVVIVPAGANHNIINLSQDDDLKLYTLYALAHHKDKTLHQTKEEALENDEVFDGILSE